MSTAPPQDLAAYLARQFEATHRKLDGLVTEAAQLREWRRGHEREHQVIDERLSGLHDKIGDVAGEVKAISDAVHQLEVDKAKLMALVSVAAAGVSMGASVLLDWLSAAAG